MHDSLPTSSSGSSLLHFNNPSHPSVKLPRPSRSHSNLDITKLNLVDSNNNNSTPPNLEDHAFARTNRASTILISPTNTGHSAAAYWHDPATEPKIFPGIVHRRARTESLRSSDTADVPPGREAKKVAGRDDDDKGGDAEESDADIKIS